MMSQRERGVEAAGGEMGRSGPAEAGGQRSVSDDVGTNGQRRSFGALPRSGFVQPAIDYRRLVVENDSASFAFSSKEIRYRNQHKVPMCCDGFVYSGGENLRSSLPSPRILSTLIRLVFQV
jgi:hypothetical protein